MTPRLLPSFAIGVTAGLLAALPAGGAAAQGTCTASGKGAATVAGRWVYGNNTILYRKGGSTKGWARGHLVLAPNGRYEKSLEIPNAIGGGWQNAAREDGTWCVQGDRIQFAYTSKSGKSYRYAQSYAVENRLLQLTDVEPDRDGDRQRQTLKPAGG